MMYLSLLYVAVLKCQRTPPFNGGTQIQQPWFNMPKSKIYKNISFLRDCSPQSVESAGDQSKVNARISNN